MLPLAQRGELFILRCSQLKGYTMKLQVTKSDALKLLYTTSPSGSQARKLEALGVGVNLTCSNDIFHSWEWDGEALTNLSTLDLFKMYKGLDNV
jgi:hypothetical protein